jgi:hypothetical protein
MTPPAEILCPEKCPLGYRHRQRSIYTAERAHLSDCALREANRLRGRLRLCEGCSCVYVQSGHGKLPLGYLREKRWHSDTFP